MSKVGIIDSLTVGSVRHIAMTIKDIRRAETKAGQPYLAGNLAVKDGSLPFNFWDYKDLNEEARDDLFENLQKSTFVWVHVEVSLYNNKKQLTVFGIDPIDQNDERIGDISLLIESTSMNTLDAFNGMLSVVDKMNNITYKTIAKQLLEENKINFMTYPAAKSVHHDYQGGLIEHTYEMFKLALGIADNLYYSQHVDKELLAVGVIAHDSMKIREYEVNGANAATGFSEEGMYKGHIVMGSEAIQKIADSYFLDQRLVNMVQHMVLAHHGHKEFGSPVDALFMEAEILHYVDMLSSRSAIYYHATKDIEPRTFTENKVFPLGRMITRTK